MGIEKKHLLPIILVILVLIFFIANLFAQSVADKKNTNEVLIAAQKVKVEIADDQYEHARGLMFRKSLGEKDGMLFIFSDEQERVFWMKNTLIPLDIVFISADSKIVDIKQDFQPCAQEPCETYKSVMPASYVLEVNAGFSVKNGLKIGDSVAIKR